MKKTTPKQELLVSESSAHWIRLCLAFFFILSVASQLFAFEAYPGLIASYGGPFIAPAVSVVVAVLIVSLEVAAIPVLLSMKLSSRVKRASTIASWGVLVYWLVIGLWQSITSEIIPNAGLFGAKVLLPQGLWLVSLMVALIVSYGFASCCRPAKQ